MVALIVPVELLVLPAQRSFTVYVQLAEVKPTDDMVVPVVIDDPLRFRIATARSPLASGRYSTSVVPFCAATVPCLPSESWSTAMTSALPRAEIEAAESWLMFELM